VQPMCVSLKNSIRAFTVIMLLVEREPLLHSYAESVATVCSYFTRCFLGLKINKKDRTHICPEGLP
jgi:hypothetical protein